MFGWRWRNDHGRFRCFGCRWSSISRHGRSGSPRISVSRSQRLVCWQRSGAARDGVPRWFLSPLELHHRGISVHGINRVRQSRGHDRALSKRHLRRHPTGRRSGLHRCSISGRPYGNSSVPVAGSSLAGSSRKHSGPSWLGTNSVVDRRRTPPVRWVHTHRGSCGLTACHRLQLENSDILWRQSASLTGPPDLSELPSPKQKGSGSSEFDLTALHQTVLEVLSPTSG